MNQVLYGSSMASEVLTHDVGVDGLSSFWKNFGLWHATYRTYIGSCLVPLARRGFQKSHLWLRGFWMSWIDFPPDQWWNCFDYDQRSFFQVPGAPFGLLCPGVSHSMKIVLQSFLKTAKPIGLWGPGQCFPRCSGFWRLVFESLSSWITSPLRALSGKILSLALLASDDRQHLGGVSDFFDKWELRPQKVLIEAWRPWRSMFFALERTRFGQQWAFCLLNLRKGLGNSYDDSPRLKCEAVIWILALWLPQWTPQNGRKE